jgi:hypothetical protein
MLKTKSQNVKSFVQIVIEEKRPKKLDDLGCVKLTSTVRIIIPDNE